MKNTILQLVILLTLFSCSEKKIIKPTIEPDQKKVIEGSWKLVYAHIEENDSIQIKDLEKSDFIKIINASHFAFFNQDKGSSENFVAGGGTYTYNGKDYVETLDFLGAVDYRGHVFPFKAEVKGDSLIQQGHEKIEEAGLDRYILEKYIRIKTPQ